MPKGLGKGLDSLIPDYYDEDFDSNSAQSLEDMLNSSNEEPDVEDESNVDNVVDKEDSNVDNEDIPDGIEDKSVDEVDTNVEQRNSQENLQEKSPDRKEEEESQVHDNPSEEISSNQSSQDDLSSSQEAVKKQENVAEVLDIVDKNPRITLWSSRSAAVFRYLRKTEPEFSISREASILIDEAVSKKYPHIWKLFEDL